MTKTPVLDLSAESEWTTEQRAAWDAVVFWDARESEELSNTDLGDEIEQALDARHPDPPFTPGEILEVTGFRRVEVTDDHIRRLAADLVEVLADWIYEHDEIGSGAEPPEIGCDYDKAMMFAAIAGILRNYKPWACVPVCTVRVDAEAWVKENAPGWLKAGLGE